MGNSASEIISRVSAASTDDLLKLVHKDIELLEDTSLVFSTAKLSLRTDLKSYSVPGLEEKSDKKELLVVDEELNLVCSQSDPGLAKERRDQAISNLITNISKNMESDIASQEVTKRLQAFCRIFEAILRSEEIAKKKSQKTEAKAEDSGLDLPATARAAIKFGLNTLLCLVECVAVLNPHIYHLVVADTNKILGEMGPLSMLASDSTLTQAFSDIAMFFDGVIAGNIPAISAQDSMNSFGPVLGLALSTGSLQYFVAFASRMLTTEQRHKGFLREIYPAMQQFSRLTPRHFFVTWDPKLKGSIELDEHNLVATAAASDSYCVVSTLEMNAGVFYFEIRVGKLQGNCYFGIRDVGFGDASNWSNSSYFSVCYKATGEVFLRGNSVFTFEPWACDDKIGVFIDMTNKKAVFYRNGVKQNGPEQEIKSESVKLYTFQAGLSEVSLNTSYSNYPEDIKSNFVLSESASSPFESLLQAEDPTDDFLSSRFEEISSYVIKKLVDLASALEYLFSSKTFRFTMRKPGLCLDLTPRAVEGLHNLLVLLLSLHKSNAFPHSSQQSLLNSITGIQKLIRFHLVLSRHIDDQSLPVSLRKSILDSTIDILRTFPEGPQTSEAAMIISSCFEVFYKEPSEKLQYIIESLQRQINKEEVLPIFRDMESQIYREMSRADKLFPALQVTDESSKATVENYFKMLIDISTEVSKEVVEGKSPNTSVISLLESTQTAMLAQAGRASFLENWKTLVIDYSKHYLTACIGITQHLNSLYKTGAVPDQVISNLGSTLISRLFDELLSALVLSPMDLGLISEVLPLLNIITSELSKISAPAPVLNMGIGVISDVYESPHNYLDGSELNHTIRVPNAMKYTLEFDPQCRTENGCDYLELWTDETKSNKVARWEGETFPKEPVEVNNPMLYFTFHSDGSVNYWGWKITIKASVECSFYQKQWPDTTKDTVELFFGFCASKLVSGKFENDTTADEVKEVFKNPLLKYGVSDKSTLLSKPLPEISSDLLKIINASMQPPISNISPGLADLSVLPDYETGLNLYLSTYSSLKEPHFSDSPFLLELFEGSERVAKAWSELKKKSGIVGGGANIGGGDLDQAERAVFAVYTAYFEVVDTMSKIFESPSEAGPTVKVIIKQATQIRSWAQKYKQVLMDAGNAEITYKIINDTVVKKCAFLLGAEYKHALQELGVSKVMKNLMSNIATVQRPKGGLKIGSKWKAVQGAVKSMSKLRGLASLKKQESESANEDIKEFVRVADLVTGFLENAIGIDAITAALEHRRVKAMARVIGLLSISKLLSYNSTKHNTLMVKTFTSAFKEADKKLHYDFGLEGTDPGLLACVQKAFFIVYRNLQQDLLSFHTAEFSYETYVHFSTVIDSLSAPLKSVDTHELLNQPIAASLKVLLDWSKGEIREKPIIRNFTTEKCITRFAVLPGDTIPEGKTKILLQKNEDQPSVYLTFEKGGNEKPITQFLLSEEQLAGLEEATGEFTHNDVKKWAYIVRSDPTAAGSFLTNLEEDFSTTFAKYDDLLEPINQEEKKRLEALRENLSRSAWNLYKQLLFSILGADLETSQSRQIKVQEVFLKVILPEISITIPGDSPHVFNLKTLSTGETWVGKNVIVPEKPTAMQSWLRHFSREKAPQEVKQMIQAYVEYVDNLKQGVVEASEFEYPQFANCKDESGKYDFFKFIESIKTAQDVSEDIAEYLRSSKLWNEGHSEVIELSPHDIKTFLSELENSLIPAAENSFGMYIDLLKNTSGLRTKRNVSESVPSDFKDAEGNLDVFLMLSAVKSNEKHAAFLPQISSIFTKYPKLPSNLSEISSIAAAKRDHVASLLWTLYASFTSPSLSGLLSHSSFLFPLLRFSLQSSSIVLQTISLRILSKVLPSQHSPQSFAHVWSDFSQALVPEDQLDLVTLLLKRIGKSLWKGDEAQAAYESQNLLAALLHSERWRSEVVQKVLDALAEAQAFAENRSVIKAAHAGAVKFLSFSDGYGVVPFVLAAVSMQDSASSKVIIKEIKDEKQVVVYSVVNDAESTAEISNIVGVHSSRDLLTLEKSELQKLCGALIRLWPAMQEASEKPLGTSFEGLVTLKPIYVSLVSLTLSGISCMLAKVEVEESVLHEVTERLFRAQKREIDLSKTLYSKVSREIAKRLKELASEGEKFTVEEANDGVSKLSDEDKDKVNELVAKGLPLVKIWECWQEGVREFEAITTHEKNKTLRVYKLEPFKESELAITDVHGTAEIYQNNMLHIIISDSFTSHKDVKFTLPPSIFHENKHFLSEITIRVVLEANENEGALSYSFSIGDLTISIDGKSLAVNGETIGDLLNSETTTLRIHASTCGQVSTVVEGTSYEFVNECSGVFNGVSIGEFKLSLEKGNHLGLVALEVHDSKVSTNYSGKIDKPQKSEGGERSIKIKTKSENVSKSRIKLLGITDQQAEEALSSTHDLPEAVQYSLTHFSPSLPAEIFTFPNDCIFEVKIFDSLALVPADFHPVPFFENFERVSVSLPEQRILAYKKGVPCPTIPVLLSLSVVENTDGETIGDLSIGEADRPNPVFSKLGVVTAKDHPIRDIVYIKASSIFNVRVPGNYEILTDKEDKCINIAPKTEKSFYIFVAVSRNLNILNTSISALESLPAKGTTYGLCDSKKSTSNPKDESTDYSPLSITELYALLLNFEHSRQYQISGALLSSILQKTPGLVPTLAQQFPLSKILQIVNSKTFSYDSLISEPGFADKLLGECLSILVSSLISPAGGRVLKAITIESKHPYDNSMDVDDVIRIPGAKSLKITFDPQCYTENGCDPLRFYAQAGHVEELKCLSGQGEASWQAFEVPGDTVHTYFHSDGSVNYWGYKFDVIPQGGGGGGCSEEELDSKIALNALSAIAKQNKCSDVLSSDRFLAPLYVYLLACEDVDDKSRVLDIMRGLFVGQSSDTHCRLLKGLVDAASKLFDSTKTDKTSHSVLQGIIMVLIEAQRHSDLNVSQSWFLDLSDLLSDMQGLTGKESSLELFLFENFKSSGVAKLDREIESGHPYTLATSSSLLQIEGAHALHIEFSAESRAEERHTALFTSDSEGKKDVEAGGSISAVTASWELKGPEVALDQDDRRATRTNSSGWGIAVTGIIFSKGINSITFLVENSGDSDYLYLGLLEAEENKNYDLASSLNSDYGRRLWSWKRSGEVYEKGATFNAQSYTTGDRITFVMDSTAKTITCMKNSVECFTFTGVAENLVPAASFGGSNQFIVIQQVETIGAATLQSKSVTVPGDHTYMWFPVNTSAKMQYKWDYSSDEKATISADKLKIAQIAEGSLFVPTSAQLRWGRHYFQVTARFVGKLSVGIAASDAVTEKNIEDPRSVMYESEGNISGEVHEAFATGDVIGCLVGIEENLVSFYRNDKLVVSFQGKLQEVPYKFVGLLSGAEQALEITPGHPESVDLFTIASEAISSAWGYKLKVVPEFKGRSFGSVNTYLSAITEEQKANWGSYKSVMTGAFQNNTAEELVSYIDQYSAAKGKDPLTLTVEEVEPTESELIYYPDLEKLSKDHIKKLFAALLHFNKRVDHSLYLFDLSIGDFVNDMQKVLLGSRSYIFFSLKNNLFKKALEKSKNDIRTEINIDRPKAARHKSKKEVDSEGQFSIFGQIYRAMAAIDNRGYRNWERVYKVNYRGEASIDAGGPYNESMSNMCDELQSSFLRLLVPTQNNVHNIGENRESWIINPAATTEIDYLLLNFLGKLMGAAIRTQNNLNLSLPPLFWKKILMEPVGIRDLRGMDVCLVQILEILRNPEAHELTRDNFQYAYDEQFTTRDSSAQEVELFPGGKEKPVTFDNCGEYADLVAKIRLSENPKAYTLIREGIQAVVPIDYLNLFSWKQLETLVCGTVDVNIDILKENTDYEGCGLADQHIQYFWEVLKEFTPKEKSLYLKFVWGRSRLPSGKDWRHMKVTRSNPNGPVNNYMPVSHTCFFTLDLPAYTNKDAMRTKLLYAITHCTDIDLDGSAGAGWEDHD